jgi:hypothetical protein
MFPFTTILPPFLFLKLFFFFYDMRHEKYVPYVCLSVWLVRFDWLAGCNVYSPPHHLPPYPCQRDIQRKEQSFRKKKKGKEMCERNGQAGGFRGLYYTHYIIVVFHPGERGGVSTHSLPHTSYYYSLSPCMYVLRIKKPR